MKKVILFFLQMQKWSYRDETCSMPCCHKTQELNVGSPVLLKVTHWTILLPPSTIPRSPGQVWTIQDWWLPTSLCTDFCQAQISIKLLVNHQTCLSCLLGFAHSYLPVWENILRLNIKVSYSGQMIKVPT